MKTEQLIYGLIRISLGWIFLWPFLDKVGAWVDGTSPTLGFLKSASSGPFAGFYHSLAGSAVVDWLFMVGLICIGLCLMLGILVKIAAWAGALMLLLMFTAVLPPEHNPVIDDHIIYGLMLIMLSLLPAGDYLGFGRVWKKTALVRQFSWLE